MGSYYYSESAIFPLLQKAHLEFCIGILGFRALGLGLRVLWFRDFGFRVLSMH